MKAATAKTRARFENILFATDFSPSADHAIPFVKELARHFQSHLLALNARLPAVNSITPPEMWNSEIEAANAIDQKHRRELLETFAGIDTEVMIEVGEIQPILEDAVKEHNTDLVVVGTHGRTGVAKMLLGSVAESIFRTVPCPVLTIGPHSDPSAPHIREILFATSLSSEDSTPAAYAVSLAQEFQARLTMLHVVRDPKPGDLASSPDVQDSSKQLRDLVPEEAAYWCKPEYFVERGDPAERILDLANLREADLIVLGVQPERGVPGASTHLPIATAHKIVTQAKCPVLTVREKTRALETQ